MTSHAMFCLKLFMVGGSLSFALTVDLRLPQLLLLLLSAQLVPYSGVFIRQEVLRLCDQLAEGRQKPLLWCVATQTSFLGLGRSLR